MGEKNRLTKGMSIILALVMIISLAIPKINSDAASKKIKLSSSKVTMTVGATKTLTLKKGSKKIKKSVKWKSSNKNVAKVSSKGKIIAKKKGTVTITATYKKKKYKCKITVKAKGSSTSVKTTPTPAKTTPEPTATPKPTAKPTATPTPAPVIELSQTTASINPGDFVELELTKDGERIKTGVKWSAANTSETPTVLGETIKVVSLHEGTGVNYGGIGYVTGEYSGTAKVTATYNGKTYSCDVTVAKGFDVEDDLEIVTGTTSIYVEFDLKKDLSADEKKKEIETLRALGCTVNESTGKVTKNQRCETAEYKFTKLPKTVEEIKTLFASPEKNDTSNQKEAGSDPNYGGFNAMAATICAANAYEWSENAADAFYETSPQGWEIREMFEFINGPYEDDNISNVAQRQGIQSMKDAFKLSGKNVYKSYFKGASYKNDYTPTEYTINMYKGPYFIDAKGTILGDRPETYMIFVPSTSTNCTALKDVASDGFDSDKYIDVWYSNADKRWYSFQNNFQHITANDIKKPSKAR